MRAQIKFKKLNPYAVEPAYAHGPDEDAGLDLRAPDSYILPPGRLVMVPTGISIEMPSGVEAQIRSRSSMAKQLIIIPNQPATIDPGFRGEIQVMFLNLGTEPYHLQRGDKIAQMVFAAYVQVEMAEDELAESVRGAGGFGSTGR